MKKIIGLLVMSASLAWSADYKCTGDAGNELKLSTFQKQVKANWTGYKSIYHKIPSHLAFFSGEHHGKTGEVKLTYFIQDTQSELQGSLKLYQTMELVEKCHRAGCSKYPVYTNHADLLLNKKFNHPYKFTCLKFN